MPTDQRPLTPAEQALLARENAADAYDRGWPSRTTRGNLAREGFTDGWDAALAWVEERRRQHQPSASILCQVCGMRYREDMVHYHEQT